MFAFADVKRGQTDFRELEIVSAINLPLLWPTIRDRAAALPFGRRSEKIVERGKGQFDVRGGLTIHGVTKAVVLPVRLESRNSGRADKVFQFQLELSLERGDYGIVWNRALGSGGVLLGETVTVQIRLEARPMNVRPGPSTVN